MKNKKIHPRAFSMFSNNKEVAQINADQNVLDASIMQKISDILSKSRQTKSELKLLEILLSTTKKTFSSAPQEEDMESLFVETDE